MNRPTDQRQYAPATQRNRAAILDVLLQVLPPTGTVLEISSGTGEHAVFFTPQLYPRLWIPSDPDPVARASILAWQQACPDPNLYPPIAIDAQEPVWAVEHQPLPDNLRAIDGQQQPIRAIVNINMIHIAPWSACLGLLAGAGRILPPGGILYLYGPFKQAGQPIAPSNVLFDTHLRSQNPAWGIRDLEAVVAAAEAQHLSLRQTIAMPANNLSVVFQVRDRV